jgi:hypothetical protein
LDGDAGTARAAAAWGGPALRLMDPWRREIAGHIAGLLVAACGFALDVYILHAGKRRRIGGRYFLRRGRSLSVTWLCGQFNSSAHDTLGSRSLSGCVALGFVLEKGGICGVLGCSCAITKVYSSESKALPA